MRQTVKQINTKHCNYPLVIDKETTIVSLFTYSKLVKIIALRLIISYQIVNDFCKCTSQT
jgi:hypothetical protein